jgi:hypothetical protein
MWQRPGSIAQLVEHFPYKEGVSSSSLLAPTAVMPSEAVFTTSKTPAELSGCGHAYSHRIVSLSKPRRRLALLRHSDMGVSVGCDRVGGMT